MKYQCPVCKKEYEFSPEQEKSERMRYFPFCSERCKLIDLGAWLDSKYRVEAEDTDISDDSYEED